MPAIGTRVTRRPVGAQSPRAGDARAPVSAATQRGCLRGPIDRTIAKRAHVLIDDKVVKQVGLQQPASRRDLGDCRIRGGLHEAAGCPQAPEPPGDPPCLGPDPISRVQPLGEGPAIPFRGRALLATAAAVEVLERDPLSVQHLFDCASAREHIGKRGALGIPPPRNTRDGRRQLASGRHGVGDGGEVGASFPRRASPGSCALRSSVARAQTGWCFGRQKSGPTRSTPPGPPPRHQGRMIHRSDHPVHGAVPRRAAPRRATQKRHGRTS